jgi:hypothetical protein
VKEYDFDQLDKKDNGNGLQLRDNPGRKLLPKI